MRKYLGIATILAAVLVASVPALAQGSGSSAQPVSTSGSYLGQYEMYHTIVGRTTQATTPEGQPISSTFHANGTYETVRGVWYSQPRPLTGTWRVDPDGTVVRSGCVGPFRLRKENGRYYSTNTGKEVIIR